MEKRKARLIMKNIVELFAQLHAEQGDMFGRELTAGLYEYLTSAEQGHRGQLMENRARRMALRSGEIVYINLADTNLYLAPLMFDMITPGKRTYNAVVGPEKVRFRVHFGNFENKPFIELKLDDHRRHPYLQSNTSLYNDGWGNVKFNTPAPHHDDPSQMWVLDIDCTTALYPGTRVKFMDRYKFGYMAANLEAPTTKYAGGGSDKKFIEAMHPPFSVGIKDTWLLERVPVQFGFPW